MAKRVCCEPGCPTLTDTTRCTEHTRQRDKARGTRQQRGYDAEHDRERAKWKAILDRRPWPCGRCPEQIMPGQLWHLDHTDDRAGYIGPSHDHCNLSAAGKAAHNEATSG